MKLVLPDVAYVEKVDITFLMAVPWCVREELNPFEPFRNHLEVFYNPESIEYWKKMDIIVDYSYVKSLSGEELSKEIASLKEKIDAMAKEYLSTPSERRILLDMDYGRRQRGEKLMHICTTLVDYERYPEKYDEMFARYLK